MYIFFLSFGESIIKVINFYLYYPEKFNSVTRIINNYAVRVFRLIGEGMNQDDLKIWFRYF